MVLAHVIDPGPRSEERPRRPCTVAALDARLSVWGQAARVAVERRAQIVAEGAAAYVEQVGRQVEALTVLPVDPTMALLATDLDLLVPLAASVLPAAITRSCRLLWVDPDKLEANINEDLSVAVEAARAEVRRRQALYRRRARLWKDDQARLDTLREEVEGLRVPRSGPLAADLVRRGLAQRQHTDNEPRLVLAAR
jgi:hypothetical protein